MVHPQRPRRERLPTDGASSARAGGLEVSGTAPQKRNGAELHSPSSVHVLPVNTVPTAMLLSTNFCFAFDVSPTFVVKSLWKAPASKP